MTVRMLPFRELLKPGTPFRWDRLLEEAFQESKAVIVNEIEQGVRIFDQSKSTCLATEWSKDLIGFWLFQKQCECAKTTPFCCTDGWKITLVGSRFTSVTESRYAPVEGESLAVADALEKARYFVLFVCLFCCFTSQVNSYGHCGMVSSPKHTFSCAGLNKRFTSNLCTYFRL